MWPVASSGHCTRCGMVKRGAPPCFVWRAGWQAGRGPYHEGHIMRALRRLWHHQSTTGTSMLTDGTGCIAVKGCVATATEVWLGAQLPARVPTHRHVSATDPKLSSYPSSTAQCGMCLQRIPCVAMECVLWLPECQLGAAMHAVSSSTPSLLITTAAEAWPWPWWQHPTG